jgi:RHS repeat-associated protein
MLNLIMKSMDYYPFGMAMVGRDDQGDYRFGFQGQETDKEIWGGSSNYKYRMSDTRIGRFFAVDPLSKDYAYYTPYSFSGNRVIDKVELEGLEPGDCPSFGGFKLAIRLPNLFIVERSL